MLRLGKLEVSGGFLLAAAILLYLDGEGIFPWALLACALHEWGHFAAVRLTGGRVESIRLTAAGGEMRLSARHVLSYGSELFAVLAGPAANLCTAALLPALIKGNETGWLFAGLNLVIGLFNLLPAYPLDGGRALNLLVLLLWTPEAAERITKAAAFLTEVPLLMAGTALLCGTRRNFTLLMTGVWLLAGTLRVRKFLPHERIRR
jgi:Zn-dependent protease